MSKFNHLIDPEAEEWAGLRLAVRNRLAKAVAKLLESGTLQRADIMALGEVSQPQASLDIRQINERVPAMMTYDLVARCYKLNDPEASA